MEDDKNLTDLEQFFGTEGYHRGFFGENLTDGVAYIIRNGYSWFVSDAMAVIKTKSGLKEEGFLAVYLKIEGDKADLKITDGNEKVLYNQHYSYTDCKRNLTLYFADNVLMLSSEY